MPLRMPGPVPPSFATSASQAGEWPLPSGRVGSTIAGRYQLLGLIGHGGMGSVYFARHVAIGKPLAVKMLDPRYAAEEHSTERLFREARAAAGIGHPNIVDVADVGVAPDGSPYLVMEYLEGEDLGSLLARVGPLPIPAACALLAPILEALAAAHEKQIVHRDLKPANIFVVRRGAHVSVKLIDFGIAKQVGGSEQAPITVGGALLGTPSYMSPEQAKGSPSVDARADLYALGVVFYQLITGRLPFDGSNYNETLFKIVNDDPSELDSTLSSLPPDAVAFIRKAIAKDPRGRYQTAGEMLTAFAALAAWSEREPALRKLDVNVSVRPGERSQITASTPSTIVSPVHDPEVSEGGSVQVVAPTVAEGRSRLPSSRAVPATRRSGSPDALSSETGAHESSAPSPSLAAAESPPPAAADPAFRPGGRWRLGATAVLGAALTAALFGLSRRESTPSPELATSAVANPAVEPARTTVTLTLSSAPDGARVWFGGVSVFSNPFSVPARDELVQLRVEKEGYEPFETHIVPVHDATISVVMLPLPPAAELATIPATQPRPHKTPPAPEPTSEPDPYGNQLRQTGRGALYSEEFE